MQGKFFSERNQSLEGLSKLPNPNWETTCTSGYGSEGAGEIFSCWVAHDNLHPRRLVELRRVKIETITQPYNLEYAGDW
jgi:hypothetical protein